MTVVSRAVDVRDVCMLSEDGARDPVTSGAKAASLATCAGRGLPVVPGFVVTTRAHAAFLAAGRRLGPQRRASLTRAWSQLAEHGDVPVVVRSSSTVEDIAAGSMAGRFRSVLGVRDWETFIEAVEEVWASADTVADGQGPEPMGVLVQRQLAPQRSGVMFGVDPVTGDDSVVVIDAVQGSPDKLVSGQVEAQHYVVSRQGRPISVDGRPVPRLRGRAGRLLARRDLVALSRLARTTHQLFSSPQDVEWAITADGHLWLLQSRPVTATAPTAPAEGAIMGPGPLAETFPDPLGELEVDLWVRPLRGGVIDAIAETGAVDASRLAPSPVVTVVNGRVAADLELFGYVPVRNPLGRVDPRPAMRQLRLAWRTGSLRATLSPRAAAAVAETDAWLTRVELRRASAPVLLALLEEAVDRLRRLHHLEALAGSLLPPVSSTAAALALHVLGSVDRREPDAVLVRRHPILLALAPPSLQEHLALPRPATVTGTAVETLGAREQLRLRIRWVQELTVRVADLLGRRLEDDGLLEHHSQVGLLRLADLRRVVDRARPPDHLAERRAHDLGVAFAPPLPAEFRLTAHGDVVPVVPRSMGRGFGTPAGGGRGVGPVCQGSVRRPPSPGDVLVVRTLDPGLAGWLPRLGGLVAETGATLSHLAILAREYAVPTVVGVHGALERFPSGARVLVDGSTGEVRLLSREEQS